MDVGERYKANCAAINMEQLTSQTQILPEKSKKQSDRLPVREVTIVLNVTEQHSNLNYR